VLRLLKKKTAAVMLRNGVVFTYIKDRSYSFENFVAWPRKPGGQDSNSGRFIEIWRISWLAYLNDYLRNFRAGRLDPTTDSRSRERSWQIPTDDYVLDTNYFGSY